MALPKPLITDELWELVRPLLPPPRVRSARNTGRKPLDPRRVLTGIVFVLKSGIAWEDLPAEMGCGCGATCLNYLRAWLHGGAWPAIRRVLQAHLPDAKRIDWRRVEGLQLPPSRAQHSA
jgi:transposase